jgi:Uma2 family endonuclease
MTSATAYPPGAEESPRRWKLTTADFERMLQAGVFQEDDPVELLDGELYEMAPIGDWHNAGVDALTDAVGGQGRGRVIVRAQGSFRLDAFSSPEPDVAVFAFRADYYREGGARPADVLLVVEVADSSEKHDREVKLPLYARAGIPEVWIVTRDPAAIEVYREPSGSRYTQLQTFGREDTVSPSRLPDIKVPVALVTG